MAKKRNDLKHIRREEAEARQAERDARTDEEQLERIPAHCQEAVKLRARIGVEDESGASA